MGTDTTLPERYTLAQTMLPFEEPERSYWMPRVYAIDDECYHVLGIAAAEVVHIITTGYGAALLTPVVRRSDYPDYSWVGYLVRYLHLRKLDRIARQRAVALAVRWSQASGSITRVEEFFVD